MLLEEIHYLRQMLADSNEEKRIQVPTSSHRPVVPANMKQCGCQAFAERWPSSATRWQRNNVSLTSCAAKPLRRCRTEIQLRSLCLDRLCISARGFHWQISAPMSTIQGQQLVSDCCGPPQYFGHEPIPRF